jgi:hypothetical protein
MRPADFNYDHCSFTLNGRFPIMPAQGVRAIWFASTVGTAAGCMVFDMGRKLCGADSYQSMALFVIANIAGGIAGSRYVCRLARWLPCLVIGFMMTVRLYDPFLGPPPDRLSVEIATVVCGSASAFWANSLTSSRRTARSR